MVLSLTLPSDQHYLLTRSYHLTLSLTDQHPVPVSNTSAELEVDKNGRVSLNPSPFTAAAWPCYVKPFGVREAWPLLKLGTKFNFHPLFHIELVSVSSPLHVWKARHGEGPIFLSTRLSDDNDGVHTIQGQELNNTQMFYYFLYAIINIKILRRLHCLISSL